MAKRTNILITIDREIKNGKTYIDKNGFFISAEAVEKDIKDSYLKALKENTSLIDNGVTLDKFKETYNMEYTPAKDIFKTLIDNLFTKQDIFVESAQATADTTETATAETAEHKQDTAETAEQKQAKAKDKVKK